MLWETKFCRALAPPGSPVERQPHYPVQQCLFSQLLVPASAIEQLLQG